MTQHFRAHMRAAVAAAAFLMLGSPVGAEAVATNAPVATVSGIPLDSAWKQKLYSFAREKLLHPAWGWTHSERDYLLAKQLAQKEGMRLDDDVLFAAAFTHDIGAIGEFQKEGVDHAERSAELVGPLLERFGFPAEKVPAVRQAILGHMWNKVPAHLNEAIVLHDADTLDFLGTIGVARRISATGSAATYSGGVDRIRLFTEKLPPTLITATAKKMAPARVAEMRRFLHELDAQDFGGQLP